jgi:PTS system mannose-specific IID component
VLTRACAAWVFVRSFVIQGSWNYHTMIASGFAFALLPALRRCLGPADEDLEAPLRRHLEHFNAHPYLASVALGATLRLEADGEDPETIRRFKVAVRGPLGSLGDALVWASWLPTVSLASLVVYWWGAPGWVAVLVFLGLYNAGHVGLRLWGFRAGLKEGRRVGRHLGQAALGVWTERIQSTAALLLGTLAGLILASDTGLVEPGLLWAGLAGAAFIGGAMVGHIVWRPAAVAVVAAVALIATWGVAR